MHPNPTGTMHMDQKTYNAILSDLISSKGPKGPTRNLVRRGVPEAQAAMMVGLVYKDLKWQMRKVHLWKVLGSGAVLAFLALVLLFTGRVYFLWIGIAGIAFLYSLFQFTFALGVDVGD